MARTTTFLARETYRRRRLIDGLRVLPFVGLLLFGAPMLGAAHLTRSTALSGVYLFSIWFLLIVCAAILVRSLSRAPGGVGVDPLDPPETEDDI